MANVPSPRGKGTALVVAGSSVAALLFAQTVAFSIITDLLMSMMMFGIGVFIGKFILK